MNKEERFVQDIRSGDKRKLDEIYSENKPHFLAFARKYRLQDDVIRDIYQESIIVFYENILGGKLTTLQSSIKTYLFAIGKYKLIEHLRKSEKHETVPFDQSGILDEFSLAELPGENEADEQTLLIKSGYKQLGTKCRDILRLFYYEEKKLDEIQQQLGYDSKDTVKSQKSRCVKQLRKLVGVYEK
ncbi:sigma-70 family RNA polymerase sigma factor [Algoriphagus sp. AGSA1]|uniref:RNA polymerase sigma factor n=1 Tax=unclassified Algoriphagus TaxID=2641541 RepID=UPI00178412BA|nr:MULTISPECIES: sigma-70 family RNA polymerase sigma factor [unclassified Algoriphagus]MCE7054700.1 sigma-70 family RNA polymerase sigma factor [Algoriphagus sp. AGSA1]